MNKIRLLLLLVAMFICHFNNSQIINGFEVALVNPEGLSLPVEQYGVNPQNDEFILATLVEGYAARSTDGGLNWDLTHGFAPAHYCIISDDIAFAVLEDKIFKSTDGGESWIEIYQYIDPVNEASLMTVSYVGHGYLYVGGNNGCILRSKNFGDDWEVMKNVTFGYNHIVNFYFKDTITGFAMGGSGGNSNRRLLKTTDGFQSEELIPSPGSSNFQGLSVLDRGFIHFVNEDVGIMGFGYHFFRTTNGGDNWMRITSMNSSSTVGKYNTVIAKGDSILLFRRSRIDYTTDVMNNFQQLQGSISSLAGGSNLTLSTIIPRKMNAIYSYSTGYLFNYSIEEDEFEGLNPYVDVLSNNNNVGIGMIHFKNNYEGIASGPFFPIGAQFSPNLWNNYAVTSDGGMSWDFESFDGDFQPHPERDYHFVDSLNGVLQRELTLNNLNPLLFTTDGGYSWTNPQTFTDSPEISFINNNGHGVHMMNKDTIFLVCNSSLLRTNDRGMNWELLSLDVPFRTKDIYFWDELNGMVVGNEGVFFSNDGGITWTQVYEGVFETISGFGDSGAVIGGVHEFLITHNFGTAFQVTNLIEEYGSLGRLNTSYMLNDRCGVISADRMSFVTFDGWETMHRVLQPFRGGGSSAVQMLADSTIVLGARHALIKIKPQIEYPLFEVGIGEASKKYCSDDELVLEFLFKGFEETYVTSEIGLIYNSDTLYKTEIDVVDDLTYTIDLNSFVFEETDTLLMLFVKPHDLELPHKIVELIVNKRGITPQIVGVSDSLFVLESLLVDWVLNGEEVVATQSNYIIPQVNGVYTAISNRLAMCPSDTSNAYLVDVLNAEELTLENNSFNVFPNPTSDFVTITFDERSEVFVRVVSSNGKLMFSKQMEGKDQSTLKLDLSGFPNGVYTVTVDDGVHLVTGRLVKK